ncbi:hypothetical protein [Streptomyces sp. NPDC127108]|uniref:hypothetical protein n=1 Tax=Streptomyces sp. NPDC127108 TaxID=3345361 RepID=UPI003636DE45
MTPVLVGFGVPALCAIGALIAAVGVAAMALPGRPEPWPVHLLRRAATMTACAAASVYSLGFFAVLTADVAVGDGANSLPGPVCHDGFDADTVRNLSHARPSYLPLGLDCVRYDGTSYASSPDYVWMNWSTLSLALCAVVLAVGAGWAAENRARRADARADVTS